MDNICIDFKPVGINEINVDEVVKRWNHLWCISQFQNDYRLYKYLRFDSEITTLKLTISISQAYELIERLDLIQEKHTFFKSASTWRRMSDSELIYEKIKRKREREKK